MQHVLLELGYAVHAWSKCGNQVLINKKRQLVCLNLTDTFAKTVPFLVSVRVSNELGAGNPRVAKLAVVVVNITTVLISLVLCVVVLVFRVGLTKAFTSDAEVIAAVYDLYPLLAVSIFLNGIQPILSGIDTHAHQKKETFCFWEFGFVD